MGAHVSALSRGRRLPLFRTPALAQHVAHVFQLRSGLKVRGIATRRVVALVHDYHSVWNRTVSQPPCNTVGISAIKSPIPLGDPPRSPNPALVHAAGSINFRPEALRVLVHRNLALMCDMARSCAEGSIPALHIGKPRNKHLATLAARCGNNLFIRCDIFGGHYNLQSCSDAPSEPSRSRGFCSPNFTTGDNL